ncbi:MAG: ATP-binding cassette domain-containing protein, partial [Planctomycetes bacterium]|nr:ATP-binding cassette domain-containing protein [Planctomycetota bacterium]
MNNKPSSTDFPPEESSQVPRKSRLCRRRRGAAVVELAVTLPLLALIVLGVTEYSQYVNAAQVVTNASRRGARLAARNETVTASEVQNDVTEFLTGALGSSASISVQVVNGSGTPITYGDLTAIHEISFQVERGEVLGFLGPNGAGKTTTMRVLTGFLPPTSGTARIAGHDVSEEPEAVKRRVGYLPEHPPLYDFMTVMEYLRFVAQV